jgi:uncharacterized protein (TIGR02453 family)
MSAELQPFRGWPPEAQAWFRELEANNSREWFQAHRATYDEAVRGPVESLLAEVESEFGEGKVARPNRDTRFSKDKSPYKLQIYATIPRAKGGGGYYVQLTEGGLFVGGGMYMPDRAALAAMRAAMDDGRQGRRLEKVVASLEGDGIHLMEHGALKTAPRGYAADHPRIRFLRLGHLAAGVDHPIRRWLHTPAAKDRIVDAWRKLDPLMQWAADAIG